MPARCSVFIATSLDGFIARPNGDLDWLDRANATVPEGEDCGYQAFMDTVDILVMGRHTYEKVRTFGAWPYEKPVVVLTSNPIDIPPDIDGGNTIQRFLGAGLITDLTITLIPILLGEGIPLFGPQTEDIALTHQETLSYPFGFVQLKYETNH